MDDPVKELKEVIRSITEPFSARDIAKNVDKYFTEDAFIMYPLFNQPQTANSRENLKGIYKLLRVFSYHGKIDFHAVMFSEDRLNATVDLTETIQPRFARCLSFKLHFITRVDLRKEDDGKFRIWRQEDNYPNDLKRSQIPIPFLPTFTAAYKIIAGIIISCVGRFLLEKGWFGV
ncbi:hypothetical protein MJO29_001336 [Puccinia striiformis f. sp. tritici]|uniref:hypothetical protein n=1 Tax=Puccinia striiformis f. sp. tritici TaxID=168172 RepID=UPI000A129FCC|nr:hypothetical protein Pst134EA_003415 [Puccinia striiformis f. sp. tritici]KAH9472813.1 hypothetical protein Pst134EA_003415 [Puccinia striiformis f. sp. tritici]KAI7965588.1 hypothetical protein MJO29_001336 [Puccinia striiformis f. sp. tritici]KAI9620067.1 hypothetical protein KEM48_008342 [Puccinia striiformis f. sp. tritici PST-130]